MGLGSDPDLKKKKNKMKKKKNKEVASEAPAAPLPAPPNCDRLLRALTDCHRRSGPHKAPCRHLNRALAECVVTALCVDEAEAVRTLCASAGTSLKRSQCRRAQTGLSACLSAHQHQQ